MNKTRWIATLPAMAATVAIVAGCGGSGGSEPGTVRVGLTDAPACGFDAVNVTVSKVRIHSSSTAAENEGGWTDITLNPARKIDLLSLTNGILSDLGQASLPAGHYTQLRLVLDSNNGNGLANTVVLSDTGAEMSLDTPSAVQSGIKLINGFDVTPGKTTDLVLDFDACKSIVAKGNGGYALKPVIKVLPATLNGIDGYVNKTLLSSHVMVTAQQNGEIVGATVPNADGKFYLARLTPGEYDVVITADNKATAVIAKVPVATTSSTVSISTIDKPVELPAAPTASGKVSGTVTYSPANTGAEPAYVTAKQTFASGPTVTIKYRGANVTDGSYVLDNLPTVAPQLGQYSTSLPIALTAQTNTTPGTGKYALDAALTGYVTQKANVDLSAADAIQNFELTK